MPHARVNGINIYYELSGEGIPLVLISGTGLHCQIWKLYQVPFFSQQRYKVLISDHRGVGHSDKPDEPYSTKLFAEDIVALMDHLGLDKAHILGHSMGGRVAQWIALDHPDRVRSLILAGTGSGNFTNSPSYIRGIPLDTCLKMVEKGYEGYLEEHMGGDFSFSPSFRAREPERYKQLVEVRLSNKPPLKCYLRHVIARQMHETSDRLHEIKAPTLVMVGGEDTMILGTGNHLESSRFLADRIPGARFVVIEGAHHCFLWEKPEESNRIILEFIREHD